jgi:hypothetical protein
VVKVLVLLGLDLLWRENKNWHDGLACRLQLLDQSRVVNQPQVSVEQEDIHF